MNEKKRNSRNSYSTSGSFKSFGLSFNSFTSSSPKKYVTTERIEDSNSNTSRQSVRSLLNSSFEEYSRNESFDLFPKTDYTYAKSGSYSPRHFRKTYVKPNMSRRRLIGVVTPPVSMLENDSDSDLELQQHSTKIAGYTVPSTADAASNNGFQVSYNSMYETDQLEFDNSDDDDMDTSLKSRTPSRDKQKQHMDLENLYIQHSGESKGGGNSAYRNYYEGMVLRSGSHLKGVKRYLTSHDTSLQRNTKSVVNVIQSASLADNANDVRDSGSAAGFFSNPDRNTCVSDTGYGTTTVTTKTVTEIEEEGLNQNNNARDRQSTRSPKTSRSRAYHKVDFDQDMEDDKDRISDEYQHEKVHHVKHMYGLDKTHDFSDSDDTYSSSSGSSEGAEVYAASARRKRRCSNSNFLVTLITTITSSVCLMFEPVTSAIWRVMVPSARYSKQSYTSAWRLITRVSRYFILMDAWLLGRTLRRGCCICLPLLILLPLLLFAGGRVLKQVQGLSEYSFFGIPSFFSSKTTHVHMGDTIHTLNFHHEVRQVLNQLLMEKRDWLSKTETEQLVKSMLGPEVENFRVNLLNIANEGNSEQSAMKVDQNDAKMRLLIVEGQMASLLAKTKNLEEALAESRKHLAGSVSGNRERQAHDVAALEQALASMRAQLESLQGSFASISLQNKKCCIEETVFANAIRDNVNAILAEMFEAGGKNSGGSAFAGWLNQNYVDHGEFERQLHMLTLDITSRISSGIETHRASSSSSFFLPTAAGTLGEDAVRLIVEDSLLKYSADRTGLPDYALESAGGSVISTRCSETFYRKTALISVFGIPLWYTSNSPRTVIQPEVHPGQCWAFKGDSGYVVIQLSVPIRPTGFSLEHIPKSLSPTGTIDSAPKEFTVYGLRSESDMDGVNLGNFTYVTVGKPIQSFDVQIRNPGTFGFMELRVLTNHGNKDYTCLYRFRVHGVPQT